MNRRGWMKEFYICRHFASNWFFQKGNKKGKWEDQLLLKDAQISTFVTRISWSRFHSFSHLWHSTRSRKKRFVMKEWKGVKKEGEGEGKAKGVDKWRRRGEGVVVSSHRVRDVKHGLKRSIKQKILLPPSSCVSSFSDFHLLSLFFSFSSTPNLFFD